MRGFIAAAVLLFSMVCVAHGQDMSVPPAPEMKAAEFLLGEYSGDVDIYFFGQKTGGSCKSKADKALNDCFIHTMVTYTMKMPTGPDQIMSGMHMLSYDRAKKQYVAWWFDSTSTTDMHMSGNFENGKLVMVSEPTDIPGMGKIVMRSTWWDVDGAVGFKLEMKQGDKWAPMMEGVFKKSKGVK